MTSERKELNCTKIGIIDDSVFLLASFQAMISTLGSKYKLLFAFENPDMLTDYLNNTTSEYPDILFLDLEFPETSGLNLIPLLKERHPSIKIIINSAHKDPYHILQSFKLGANGYLSKTIPLDEFKSVIDDIMQYGARITPDITPLLIEQKQTGATESLKLLSKRELEIVLSVVNGKTYKELAAEFFISVFTVNHHLKNIYKKLQIRSKSELISLVLKEKGV